MAACRFCGSPVAEKVIDLGFTPLANAFVKPERISSPEPVYPLHANFCERCYLLQLEEYEPAEKIFGDYAYFSSFSDGWLKHVEAFADAAIARFALDGKSKVVEAASNDGYLLQYFVKRGVPVLGIEPAKNVAEAAVKRGVPTECLFLDGKTGATLAHAGHRADLVVGNNVLAHVPDLNGFVAGLAALLKPEGVLTMEFPHVLKLLQHGQFDTIYHEHFSYFSLVTAERVFAAGGLMLFDVEELGTHGGSLRVYVQRSDTGKRPVAGAVAAIQKRERAAGLDQAETYRAFSKKIMEIKRALIDFLEAAKREGRTVAAYGAAAKGNTLLNYCGIGTEEIAYVADRNPHKQGLYLPGSHLPVVGPEKIRETKPAYLLVLPWNLREEVAAQMGFIREWGGKFVVAVPRLEVFA